MRALVLCLILTVFYLTKSWDIYASNLLPEMEVVPINKKKKTTSHLKRTRAFSEKRPLDLAMYGAHGNFIENIFEVALQEDFKGEDKDNYIRKRIEMEQRLEHEIKYLSNKALYRSRDTSPEYRAFMYAQLLNYRNTVNRPQNTSQ